MVPRVPELSCVSLPQTDRLMKVVGQKNGYKKRIKGSRWVGLELGVSISTCGFPQINTPNRFNAFKSSKVGWMERRPKRPFTRFNHRAMAWSVSVGKIQTHHQEWRSIMPAFWKNQRLDGLHQAANKRPVRTQFNN